MKILFNTNTGLLKNYPRLDDEDVIGLSSEYIVMDVVNTDKPEYNPETEILTPSKDINITTNIVTNTWIKSDKEIPTVLQVSMRSLKLALIDLSLYESIISIIDGIVDEVEKLKVQTWWNNSPIVHRGNPYVLSFSSLLNKTDEEVNAIFSLAKSYDLQ